MFSHWFPYDNDIWKQKMQQKKLHLYKYIVEQVCVHACAHVCVNVWILLLTCVHSWRGTTRNGREWFVSFWNLRKILKVNRFLLVSSSDGSKMKKKRKERNRKSKNSINLKHSFSCVKERFKYCLNPMWPKGFYILRKMVLTLGCKS